MAQNKRNERFTTDKGTAVYPHLVEPDTKYDSDGVYQMRLRLPADAQLYNSKRKAVGTVQEVLDDKVRESFEDFSEKHPKKKVREADAPYEIDEETGDLLVKFKLNAKGKTAEGKQFTQEPALFDAKGKRTKPKRVWNGSVVIPGFEIVPYFMQSTKDAGISLRMKAVQIIELVESGGPSADAFGFGAEEGYEDGNADSDDEADLDDEYEQEARRQADEDDDDDNEGDF